MWQTMKTLHFYTLQALQTLCIKLNINVLQTALACNAAKKNLWFFLDWTFICP